jgi:predicted dehydrogenase
MPLTVGIVGLGGMGELHASNAVELGHEVAGADVAPEMRDAFAAQFDAPVYADHESLLGAGVDAVVITTPNAYHAPAAVAALEADVPVLCEKPLADSLSAAREIEAAAHESGAFCMVGFNNRFSAAAEIVTDLREAGRLGEIRHVETGWVRRRGIPGLGTWFTKKELSGGGALIDIGVHALDFGLHLAGYPEVVSVSGVTRADYGADPEYVNPDEADGGNAGGEFDVDDSASAFVRCADGTTIDLEAAWASNREPSREVVDDGTGGSVETTIGGDAVTLREVGAEGPGYYADAELSTTYGADTHAAEDRYFLETVDAGETPARNTLEEGMTVQRILDAIYRSSETGEEVRLD